MADSTATPAEETATAITPDLSKLIDTPLLRAFGERTIVPINGTIGALAVALNALSEEVDEIESGGATNVGKRLDSCEQNILALTLALSIEQGAEVTGTSDNIVVEVFSDTSGYIVASGIYDSTNHRLYA